MNFGKRAMGYVFRKPGKSVVLFLIFFVVNITILGTLSVLNASFLITDEMRKQTNARVIVECRDTNKSLTERDYEKLLDMDNVNEVNRMAKCVANPRNLLITGDEKEDTAKVCIIGFDDMEKDSPFTENVCRMVDGEFPKGENEIVINQMLAENNQINMGDTLIFDSGTKSFRAKVTGFYLTGNERKQTDTVLSINRIENQIYTTLSFVSKLGADNYERMFAYVKHPEQISETRGEISKLLGDGVTVSTQDAMYQKMKFSFVQTERVTKLVFGITLVTSIFVVGMLLSMWSRNRKAEIAIYISLGISKAEVFLQMAVEIIFIYSLSSVISAGTSGIVTKYLAGMMDGRNEWGKALNFSMWNVLKVWIIGVIVLTIENLIALLPCLTKKIKDTLSEMEG